MPAIDALTNTEAAIGIAFMNAKKVLKGLNASVCDFR